LKTSVNAAALGHTIAAMIKHGSAGTDAFEARGEWWRPRRLDHKVPGILTFSRETGAELALLGSLRSIFEEGDRSVKDGVTSIQMTPDAIDHSDRYPRLHGLANGHTYTLADCIRTHSSGIPIEGRGYETIYANRVLRGALFEADEPLEATGISLGLTWLADWVMETGIKEEWAWREDQSLTREDEPPSFKLEARVRSARQVVIGSGASVSLKHNVGMEGDGVDSRALTQGFWWRVELPGKVSIDDLLDLASDLQDLVSIGTDRTAAFESVSFAHPDIYHEMQDGSRVPLPIELFVKWNAKADPSRRRPYEHDFLFSFKHLGSMDGVHRWMDSAQRHRGALSRAMGSRYAKEMFVTDRLLNCSAALEAFDRQITGYENSKLKVRLGRCAALAGQLFTDVVGDVDKWKEAVRVERDEVAHHFGRRMRATATETYYLWQSLYWLFVICMMKDCGSPDEVFDHMRKHSEYQWLAPRIQAVI
jgi:ApeA N-terminal domain 1